MICGAALLALAALETKSAGPFGAVSTTERTNATAASGSFLPSLSSDGRFVVFVSHARNLVTNDDLSPYLNVFMRDLAASNTVLLSVNGTGFGGGNADAHSPAISSNGQFVAFVSAASNLVNNDTNDAPDIFVRDRSAGVTRLVSVDITGTSSAGVLSPWTRHRLSSNPLISADGRWVIFESLATNLVALADANQMTDVFARDLQSNRTFLVSVNAAGTASGNGNSESADVTPDGRFVAFVSTSSDLVPGATNQLGDIYVRDLQSASTAWASVNAATFFINSYRCFNPVISADGRFVAFKASSPQFPNTVLLVRHDLQVGVSTVLASNSIASSSPQISADGRFVASENFTNVYLWDVQMGSNTLVSVDAAGTGSGNKPSQNPVMTPDAHSVVFLSAATNLTSNATNGFSQVYCRDVIGGLTRLISVASDGFGSSSEINATLPAISADGRLIAFETLAADLVVNDLNQASDVFLRDLNSATTQLISQRQGGLPETTATAHTSLNPPLNNTAGGTVISNALPASPPHVIAADGHGIVFVSDDSNLVLNDNDQLSDIFVRDFVSGSVVRLAQDPAGNSSGYRIGAAAALSGNGRYAAVGTYFSILFTPLLSETITRYDLVNGSNELVSLQSGGIAAESGNSFAPAISSDGNSIAFSSAPSDTVNPPNNVLVRDMSAGTNKLVSINYLGTAAGNGVSMSPAFSPDDRWILFRSIANNLTTNNTGGAINLFARDLLSNTTRMISVGPDGSSPIGYSRMAAFSADSRHVVFLTSSNSASVYDFVAGTSTVVCTACDNPSISADGRLVAYETIGAAGSVRQSVVKNLQTGLTNLISVNGAGTGGGNGSSTSPQLSWDGRFVVFASKASDLVDNDTNNASDIFVRDRALGTTLLVSMNLEGTGPGNSASSRPLLAADGRTVAFQSFASDLVTGDFNQRRDVFVLRLGGSDTDHDGMDDDWEMAYFGTLARDGMGDFDNDGHSDRQEFLAGTDPTNSGSILRVLTLTPLGGGGTRVIWSASPGKSYRVQFKDDLNDSNWSYLPGAIIAAGTTAAATDTSGGVSSHRFYRAILAP